MKIRGVNLASHWGRIANQKKLWKIIRDFPSDLTCNFEMEITMLFWSFLFLKIDFWPGCAKWPPTFFVIFLLIFSYILRTKNFNFFQSREPDFSDPRKSGNFDFRFSDFKKNSKKFQIFWNPKVEKVHFWKCWK